MGTFSTNHKSDFDLLSTSMHKSTTKLLLRIIIHQIFCSTRGLVEYSTYITSYIPAYFGDMIWFYRQLYYSDQSNRCGFRPLFSQDKKPILESPTFWNWKKHFHIRTTYNTLAKPFIFLSLSLTLGLPRLAFKKPKILSIQL